MPKILIIKDDPDIAAIERDYLELSGYEAVICANGTAGLNAALTESYDQLLLDLMPGSAYAIVNGPASLSTPLPPMNLTSFRWPAFLLGIVLLLALELLKQAWDRLAALRPAKLTAPAGFQVFADGAHRHKVPVLAVQQTLVVCPLEQPTGIRQLLLLLGNQLVKILCVSEGPLIGGFFILDELRIPCQFLPVFLCQLLVGIGYIRYIYEQVHENIQSNNDKQRDVSLFIQAQHGGKVYHSYFFRQSQHKHGNKNNNCDEQSPTKPTPLFYE